MAKKKPDPADFRFENRSNETLTREPGQISPYEFSLDSLSNCKVYLMDKISQVTADKIKDSYLHFGPTEDSIFLRDCENCVVTAACGQLRTKNCKNVKFYLFCNSDPSIEYSSELVFGPYNFAYPLQDKHMQESKLNLSNDKWSQIFDFNKKEGEEHWQIMDAEDFEEMSWEKPELGEPVNPVPRHQSYGGQLSGDILVGSQQHGEQGLMSFGFDVTQQEAEKQVNENPFDNPFDDQGYTPFNEEPQNPFGDDPFSQPAPSSQPDPFGGDPFGAEQPQNGQTSESSPFDVGAQESPEEEVDDEEVQRNKLREQEHQERMRKLYEFEEEERDKREQRKAEAKNELKKFYEDREKQIQQKKEMNREEESHRAKQRKGYGGESWKRVASMINFKDSDRKEQARMKGILLSKKHN